MSTSNDALLPENLVWEGAHLSEIALTALGDGQDAIVPKNARAHVVTCEACALAMGHAAMLSEDLGAVLRAPAVVPVDAIERAPVPWLAIVGALVVAALGSASSLLETSTGLLQAPSAFAREIPLTFHAGSALVRGITNGVGPLVSFVCAAVLFATGALVARSMPRAWANS